MLTNEDNELLTRVGPDTAMGTLFRRYWIPAFRSDELVPGGDPKRVRLLGENLIGYRDAEGLAGLLDEACPHRGASLAIGRAEPCGVRCLYHGWLVAPDGTVLETPAEPEGHGFKGRIRAKSYPLREVGGIGWTYLGPPAEEPEFQEFEFCTMPSDNVLILKALVECNYAQVLEGVLDSSHSDYLHSDMIRFVGNSTGMTVLGADLALDRPTVDRTPRIEVENTPYGFRYAALRKAVTDPERELLVRVTLFIAPFYGMFPAPASWANMQMMVPVDDYNTMFYFVKWSYDGAVSEAERERHANWSGLAEDKDFVDAGSFRRIKTPRNNWLQDRKAMRTGSSFTGISGVNIQDFAVEESMGPLFDRSKEHLGAADAAVIRMRRLLIDGARKLGPGEPPMGLQSSVPWGALRAAEAIVPANQDWRVSLSTEGTNPTLK